MTQQQIALFTREPVVNKKRAITANRLIAHGSSVATVVAALDELTAVWPGHHHVFLSLGRLVPTTELLAWQAPDNVIIEIPVQALGNPRTLELVTELNAAGRPMNLTWYTPDTTLPLPVDWRFVLMDVRREQQPALAPGLKLAWGLNQASAFAAAIQSGYDGASGWFFLHGTPPPRALEPNHAQTIRLLNLVRNNAELREIEDILKQDVAISYKLLRYINSAGFGLMCEIQSFRHAVSILGYDALNKWLSLLLVTASRDPGAQAMMQTAIARGRFMEEVGAAYLGAAEADNLFITGAFSLLPQLLGASMQTVLEEMSLPESISEALLNDEGELAPFLRLARSAENFDGKVFAQAAAELHLDHATLNRALLSGVSFADSLQA